LLAVATPQNQQAAFDTIINELLANPAAFVAGFQKSGFTVLDKHSTSLSPVGRIESWLTSVRNRAEVEALSEKLKEVIQSLDGAAGADLSTNAKLLINLPQAKWGSERRNVGLSLIVAMVREKEPSLAMYFNRLMLVYGLIEFAALTPGALRTPDDIFKLLRWRSVLLPKPFVEFLRQGSQWLTSWGKGAK
jgi:hypothetical protein